MTFYWFDHELIDHGHAVLVVIDPAPPSMAVAINTILFRAGMLVRVPLEQRITAKVFEEKWQDCGEKMNIGIANRDYLNPLNSPNSISKLEGERRYSLAQKATELAVEPGQNRYVK